MRPWNRLCIAALALRISSLLPVESKLLAALVLPHGDFAYDPTLISSAANPEERAAAEEVARKTRQACRSFLNRIARHHQLHQDQERHKRHVIFFSTPHGISVENDFALLTGAPQAAGSATLGQDLVPPQPNKTYTVGINHIPVNQSLSNQLYQYLRGGGGNANSTTQNAVTLLNASPDGVSPIPLFWGEVIPLLLIQQQQANNEQRGVFRHADSRLSRTKHRQRRSQRLRDASGNPSSFEHIIWSHPRRRLDHASEMVDELLHVGSLIRQYFDQQQHYSEIDWSIVISGDLAHTHRADGPYGYSPDAAKLDQAFAMWASSGQTGDLCTNTTARESLLSIAPQLQRNGKACAFTGLILLHGILCGDDTYNPNVQNDDRSMAQSWKSELFVNLNVTYYGMMAAEFWSS